MGLNGWYLIILLMWRHSDDGEWVLTAAHCCQDEDGVGMSNVIMNFGQHQRNAADANEFSLSSTNMIVHPSYSGNFDLCLVKAPSNIFTTGTANNCGSDCVAGWGAVAWEGATSNTLQSVGVNIFSDEYCVAHTGYGPNAISSDEMCAGLPDGDDADTLTDAGKDSCQGDSGGPLICNVNGKATLNGIVSWGNECASAGYPGVYGEVFDYKTWITSTMAAN